MIVLGIHMGHDAAVAVVVDGTVRSLIEKERRVRVKHAAIATIDDIDLALADAGVALEAVDSVAVTTTQNWPFLFTDPARFRFEYDPGLGGALGGPAFMREHWAGYAKGAAQAEARARRRLLDFKAFPDTAPLFDAHTDPGAPETEVLFTRQFPFAPRGWLDRTDPASIVDGIDGLYADRDWRSMLVGPFHAPISCRIRDRTVPGVVVQHHLAHAAAAYYQSDADAAAIVTYDGGFQNGAFGYTAGVYAIGEGRSLYPVWFNHSHAGNLYRRVADACGLGGIGGPGKLMGLAPYGEPRFHDESFVGTVGELAAQHPVDGRRVVDLLYETAWPYIRHAVAAAGPDTPVLPVMEPLAPFSRDLAASVQATFELQALQLVEMADRIAGRLGVTTDTLCLSGGCALNCPANSRIWRESRFRRVFVPPSCDDSGLALGAALYVAHTLLGDARVTQGADTAALAYLGRRVEGSEIRRVLEAAVDLQVERPADAAQAAASEAAAGGIIGWVEGRSEIGPRALGHRSIVADPRDPGNLDRVNDLKSRERWRPLAPAVLVERQADWFDGGPPASPHMLFTADVRGDRLPAVTHVDGSARVQTVDRSCGGFRRLVEAFEGLTGVPAVLNTSLNGRGEPIVDGPGDAVELFRRSALDALYLDGHRVTRRNG